MATTRIIPGVSVDVIKEVVPPQLSPSGVLGLIGFTEKAPAETIRASNWNTFIECLGSASAYSMPEARQAIQNGVSQLVICSLSSDKGKKVTADIPDSKNKKTAFTLEARAPGSWALGLEVKIKTRKTDSEKIVFDLSIQIPGSEDYEIFRNCSLDKSDPCFIGAILKANSSIAVLKETIADSASIKVDDNGLCEAKFTIDDASVADDSINGSAQDYLNVLENLVNEPDVDMVLASILSNNIKKHANINSAIISHCKIMSADCKGRIGFGHIPLSNDAKPVETAKNMVDNLVSDRFILLAPNGVAGAAAGMIGCLSYYESPTFKTITGLDLSTNFGLEDQKKLLTAHVVPIVKERGKGIILLRGLTTDGDQINVRRIADRAVRGVKMIGEMFIGRLNNDDGRNSLKQKIIEFLMQMQKENAIVPSTDGTDPAFKINVYSSQADFTQGIVRVDIAVRPVRAIDFIYATILVQV